MGRGKRRTRASAQAHRQELLAIQPRPAAQAAGLSDNHRMLMGMVFGWKHAEGRPAELNQRLRELHQKANARQGLAPPQGVIASEYLDDQRMQTLGAFTDGLTRGRHLFAVYGSEGETRTIARLSAELFEQGYVEIDATDKDAAAQLKRYAAEPLAVLLRNLPDSELESRVDFQEGGRKLLVDGQEVGMLRLTGIYLPVASENPPVEEILGQAETASLYDSKDMFDGDAWLRENDPQQLSTTAAALAVRRADEAGTAAGYEEMHNLPADKIAAAVSATVTALVDNKDSLRSAPSTEQLAELWASFALKFCHQYASTDRPSAVKQALHWAVGNALKPYCANRVTLDRLLAAVRQPATELGDELNARLAAAAA